MSIEGAKEVVVKAGDVIMLQPHVVIPELAEFKQNKTLYRKVQYVVTDDTGLEPRDILGLGLPVGQNEGGHRSDHIKLAEGQKVGDTLVLPNGLLEAKQMSSWPLEVTVLPQLPRGIEWSHDFTS